MAEQDVPERAASPADERIAAHGPRCPSCGKPFDELPEHHTFTYGNDQSQAICFNVPLEQP